MNTSQLRRAAAEAVGTYCLITAGCGAIMVNSQTQALGQLGIALAFGLSVLVMISAIGHLSGAHFNPAVTIAFTLTRHFLWKDALYYVGGQFTGAILGTLTLRLLLGDVAYLGATFPAGSIWQAFGFEILLTAMLMFVIIAVATDPHAQGSPAALAIGFTVMLGALWGGMVSGGSMNPARSFAPALISGIWKDQWIYWIAPLIGAFIGASLYQWLRGENNQHRS